MAGLSPWTADGMSRSGQRVPEQARVLSESNLIRRTIPRGGLIGKQLPFAAKALESVVGKVAYSRGQMQCMRVHDMQRCAGDAVSPQHAHQRSIPQLRAH